MSSYLFSGIWSGRQVKYAFANVATNTTDGALVAAVTGRKIRVLGLVARNAATAQSLTFNSKPSGAGAAISALFALPVNGSLNLDFNPYGWFETVAGEGLSVTTAAAGSTTGVQIAYVEI